MIELGQILCFKTTGELCVVIGIREETGMVVVRRPVMHQKEGISHVTMEVSPAELETTEEHLRREANEMIFKSKLQDEVMDSLKEYQEGREAKKKPNALVN